jgi:succinyl-diaminopimelate desuccinylase
LDVVPDDSDQFNPYIENGKLFGRGAYDMKAGAAVMILLFKEIAKKVGYPIALQLVTEEEASGHDGTKLQIENGITADFVIAGESSDHAIKTKAKGVLWMKVTLHGKSSHAAYPWLGDNALQKMVTLVQKLNQAYPNPNISSWQTTLNIAKIETPNSTFNKVPDICTAWIDLRFIPEEEKDIIKKVKKILPVGTDVEIIFNEKPHFTDPEHPFIQQLQKVIQKNTGKKAAIIGAHGTTDLRFYSSLINVSGIEYGPTGGGAHGDNEWVDIKSLEQYYEILKQFLLSIK